MLLYMKKQIARKEKKRLCIEHLTKLFLEDENGRACQVQMACLKPKVGLGTMMEKTPEHLPDIGLFSIKDIIDGLFEVLPL